MPPLPDPPPRPPFPKMDGRERLDTLHLPPYATPGDHEQGDDQAGTGDRTPGHGVGQRGRN